jgi:hypothetical protein
VRGREGERERERLCCEEGALSNSKPSSLAIFGSVSKIGGRQKDELIAVGLDAVLDLTTRRNDKHDLDVDL